MKIDTSKIVGFTEMTADEKLTAILELEIEQETPKNVIDKSLFDKTASELAETKRQLKAKLTEDEQKMLKEAEEKEAAQLELETLRKQIAISENSAKFLGLGYSEEDALKASTALNSNDLATLFTLQSEYNQKIEKGVEKKLLESTTRPSGKTPERILTKKDYDKLSFNEKNKIFKEQPDVYKQIMEG